MSVNQNNSTAYGSKPTGLLSVFNPPIISNRNPTTSDKAPIGTMWINKVLNSAYVLSSIVANAAQWLDIAGGGGAFMSLSVVPGGIGINLPAPGAGQLAATGNISTTTGNITATAGSINAGTTVTAGTGITATTGNITDFNGAFASVNNQNSTATPQLQMIKSRGIPFTIVQPGDTLGNLFFVGADGTQLVNGAYITAVVVGTPGVGRIGTNLQFATHPDGATGINPVFRMVLNDAGHLVVFQPDDMLLPGIVASNSVNGDEGNSIGFAKDRAGAIVPGADDIGYFQWWAYDGANYQICAAITGQTGQVTNVGVMPGQIVFGTSPTGGNNPQPRMTLDEHGVLNLNEPDGPANGIALTTANSAIQVGTYVQVGGFGGPGLLSGAGSPNGTVQANKGSLYLNTTGSSVATRAYINTDGAMAWTNLVTAA